MHGCARVSLDLNADNVDGKQARGAKPLHQPDALTGSLGLSHEMTKHPQHSLGFCLNSVLPNISSARISGQTKRVCHRQPVGAVLSPPCEHETLISTSKPRLCTQRRLKQSRKVERIAMHSGSILPYLSCISASLHYDVPSLDALFIHFECFLCQMGFLAQSHFPFPRFYPFPYHVALRSA